MIQRGLIIGTSHCAALRLAWAASRSERSKMSLDFAAMHGDVSSLVVRGITLTGRSAEACASLECLSGAFEFDLTSYDFIAVCGGTTSTYHAIEVYRVARWFGLPSIDARSINSFEKWSLVSKRCAETAISALIRASSGRGLLAAIVDVTSALCIAIPHPALSHDALKAGQSYATFQAVHKSGDGAALAQILDRASAAAFRGIATEMVPPLILRQDHFFTHSDFRRGAKRLGRNDNMPQPDSDYLHGNADYGQIILSALEHLI